MALRRQNLPKFIRNRLHNIAMDIMRNIFTVTIFAVLFACTGFAVPTTNATIAITHPNGNETLHANYTNFTFTPTVYAGDIVRCFTVYNSVPHFNTSTAVENGTNTIRLFLGNANLNKTYSSGCELTNGSSKKNFTSSAQFRLRSGAGTTGVDLSPLLKLVISLGVGAVLLFLCMTAKMSSVTDIFAAGLGVIITFIALGMAVA